MCRRLSMKMTCSFQLIYHLCLLSSTLKRALTLRFCHTAESELFNRDFLSKLKKICIFYAVNKAPWWVWKNLKPEFEKMSCYCLLKQNAPGNCGPKSNFGKRIIASTRVKHVFTPTNLCFPNRWFFVSLLFIPYYLRLDLFFLSRFWPYPSFQHESGPSYILSLLSQLRLIY
jgi:hypothetical protein